MLNIRKAMLLLMACTLCGFSHAEPTEISFYFPIAVGGPVAKSLSALVADFEKENPDIRVTPTYTGTYKDSIVKALTAHRSGTPPDVAVLFAVDMFTLIDAGAIVPFDDLVSNADDVAWMRGFYPALMANSRAAGQTWGIPFQRSTILLYWNKELFRQAGLDPDLPPANWTQMADFAQKLTRRDDAGITTQWGLQIPSSGFPYWLFQGLVTGNGAQLMNEAGTKTWFDRPAVVEALQYWVDLSRTRKVHPPGVIEWGNTPSDFLSGKAAMIWTTSGNLTNLKAKAGFAFGVGPLPGNKHAGSPTGGGNFYVFRKTTPARQKAAFRFVQWMVAPERTARWSIDSGYIGVSPAAWDTHTMKDYLMAYPQAAVARNQLSHAVAELSTHENQRVTRALNAGLVSALTGAKTPQEALKDAQTQAEHILLPYQR
ncbi:sn-glycerol 3-phosphate transport system substrate-binding protein [Rhodoferax saidenbachensis]|uniref:Sn-glycerol 3-phosphate transport system substrate-binding protein n=2 Tax=Rhodoferax saidenbachensis TaxID=1484693 RepID=A0ABU1ZTP4_9BURK|nr:ABC transporter substrate-binding protein [Rhodoferax saidenbachensis]MDR7308932.1 sn-glycerol 3-phosphate transport system substrate-binding protein [Rhodoferax saidenbachensis]